MKVKILMDNREGKSPKIKFRTEWGFAAFIEFAGKNILLDTGASAKFVRNAKAMGVDLSEVDCGILSHAHFDHSNGMKAFFSENRHAPFYLRAGAGENCYHEARVLKLFDFYVYIGIRRGWLKRYGDRIRLVDGDDEILPGVHLVGHKDCVLDAEGRAAIGRGSAQYVKVKGRYLPDSYDHEQSLVFETSKGLFIMNSCSHGGADNIIREIQATFPGRRIYALLGGFHLYKTPDEKVREFAERLRELDVQKIYTGHCTGQRAFEILKGVLGDRVSQMFAGLELEI